MDILSEKTQNVPKLSNAKAAIFQTFNELRKWRENQLQMFQDKQLMDHHIISQESGKKLEQFLENNKSVLFKGRDCASDSNLTASDSTFQDQDSSVSGHIMRCFSDSSQNDSTVFQSKIPDNDSTSRTTVNGIHRSLNNNKIQDTTPESLDKPKDLSAPKKAKQPFLRKGSGLMRFAPKQKADLTKVPQYTAKSSAPQRYASDFHPEATLKLKPAIVKTSSPPRKVNRVKFKEPVLVFENETSQPLPKASHDNFPIESNDDVQESCSEDDKTSEKTELEKRELDEFELLENFAQNSSFNSDSSVVQRVLHGEPIKPSQQNSESALSSCSNRKNVESVKKIPGEVPVLASKLKVDNYVEDIPSRKKHLQSFISDINLKIASLQKEVSNSKGSNYEASEVEVSNICSTPVKSKKNVEIPFENSDCETPQNSPSNSAIFCPENDVNDNDSNDRPSLKHTDTKNLEKLQNSIAPEEKECGDDDSRTCLIDKSKLREKMQELEKEIESYQTENAHLACLSKERGEVLQKLKKEYDEIQKFKEEEKKKLQTEIENERRHLKRQRETFNRYQRLRSDNPNRKEREEVAALRQEIEKLQEEVKKQRIRFNNDTRRLKNQLMASEKERDGLKLDNITLEDQVQDLLQILKGRNLKKKKPRAEDNTRIENKDSNSNGSKKSINIQDVNELEHSSLNLKGNSCTDESSFTNHTKSKVRFNLVPECNFSNDKHIEIETLKDCNVERDSSTVLKEDVIIESSNESEIEEPLYKEINHDDKVERVYSSGEKEIIYPSGTLKHISADGKTIKILYHNGDVKEIFPDQREVYKYVSGVIEKYFPYGLEVTMFPDGQIQKIHPDGLKEVKFPDGTVHFIHCNGAQEILAKDGIMVRLDPDGTETIEFPSGEKEIRKDDYKRREYPDGSIKTVYESGRQETRYANGRIRIKDKNGKLLVDTKHLKGLASKFS